MIWIFSQFENFPDVSTRLIIPNHTFLSAGAKIKLQLVVQNIFLLDFFIFTTDFVCSFEWFRFFLANNGFQTGWLSIPSCNKGLFVE